MFLNVMGVVGGREDFGFIYIVYAYGFQNLFVSRFLVSHLLLLKFSGESGKKPTWHSTKCPIRAFAMTGMVTVAMISLIIFGSDIRATPPCARISAGTRSRAMTAHAPASSAILAYRKVA